MAALLKSIVWTLKFVVVLGFAMLVLNTVFGVDIFTPLIFSYSGFLTGLFFILFLGLFIYF